MIDLFIAIVIFFVSIIWAWTGVELMNFPRQLLFWLGGLDVIHPERRHFQFRGVGMSTGHHHKAVPYVAAMVGAILAVVCLIAWALN